MVELFDLRRRLAAEALGTGLLVATVVGSGIMAETLTDDTALALLGNTLATGAILVVLITILGPISGAHFNPAVTLVFALQRRAAGAARPSPMSLRRSSAASPARRSPMRMFDMPIIRAVGEGADRRRRNGLPRRSRPSAS